MGDTNKNEKNGRPISEVRAQNVAAKEHARVEFLGQKRLMGMGRQRQEH